MAGDKPITASEQRAAEALRDALHAIARDWPVQTDAAGWVERAPVRHPMGARLPVGLAAALVVLLAGVVAFAAWPRIGSSSVASRHFDNGQFSFDHPLSWRLLSSDPAYPVLGTGSLCSGMPSSGCAEETMDISGGRIVVRLWQETGPAQAYCTRLGATASSLAIQRFIEDSLHATLPTTRWEIRRPGYEFGMNGNVWVEAITTNQAELTEALALVNSLRFDQDYCAAPTAPPTLPGRPGHFDGGSFSFDYQAAWRVISGDFLLGTAGHVWGVIGTGDWRSGCHTGDNRIDCTADTADVSGGRVVVEISTYGGPPPDCAAQQEAANATVGAVPVLKMTEGGMTTWNIAQPGDSFYRPNSVIIRSWTGSDAAMAEVEALIASFEWAPGVTGFCASQQVGETPEPASS